MNKEYNERAGASTAPTRPVSDRAATKMINEETRTIEAILRIAPRAGGIEFAASLPTERRGSDDEAMRIAHDHGFNPQRVTAMRSLASSRGQPLESVLRAALRGELRRIVELPPVTPAPRPTTEGK